MSYEILLYYVCYCWMLGTYFFRARFTSFHTHASLLTFLFCLFIWRGRVDYSSFFDYLSPFCFFVNWISLYFFHFLQNIKTFCLLLLYFDQDVIGCRDFFLSCPLYFFIYSRLSSYLLRLFLYLNWFLLFPSASVWENTCAWVPHFL